MLREKTKKLEQDHRTLMTQVERKNKSRGRTQSTDGQSRKEKSLEEDHITENRTFNDGDELHNVLIETN